MDDLHDCFDISELNSIELLPEFKHCKSRKARPKYLTRPETLILSTRTEGVSFSGCMYPLLRHLELTYLIITWNTEYLHNRPEAMPGEYPIQAVQQSDS